MYNDPTSSLIGSSTTSGRHRPRAVVTGGTGHLGTNLAHALLDDGWTVTVLGQEPLDREMPDLDHLTLRRLQVDIFDREALGEAFADADVVFHLAGVVSISERDADAMWSVNVEGTRNVVHAAIEAQVGRLVHYSSVTTLVADRTGHIDESRPLVTDPRAPTYHRSKAAGEQIVLDAARAGLDAVIVNPTGVFGPLDRGPSALGCVLLRMWSGRLPATTPGGFDWVDVRDVAAGAVAAARRGNPGHRYILGGSRMPITELAELAAEMAGVRAPRLELPFTLAQMAAPVALGWSHLLRRPPQFTPASVRSMREFPTISIERARTDLGYRPRPLEQSLRDTRRWFQRTGVLAGPVDETPLAQPALSS